MELYENNKRVCARGITFINDSVLLIERHKREGDKVLHYFTIPGGGVEIGELQEEAAIRETLEETCVNTSIVKFLAKEEYETGIVYWYLLKYLNGTPKLGGEELERNNSSNHYKVVLIKIDDVWQLPILGEGKNVLKKAYTLYQSIMNNQGGKNDI